MNAVHEALLAAMDVPRTSAELARITGLERGRIHSALQHLSGLGLAFSSASGGRCAEWWREPRPSRIGRAEQWIRATVGPFRRAMVVAGAGVSIDTATDSMRRMAEAGEIVCVRFGVWVLKPQAESVRLPPLKVEDRAAYHRKHKRSWRDKRREQRQRDMERWEGVIHRAVKPASEPLPFEVRAPRSVWELAT